MLKFTISKSYLLPKGYFNFEDFFLNITRQLNLAKRVSLTIYSLQIYFIN